MPDPLEALRNDIAEAIATCVSHFPEKQADRIMAVLAAASGEQRRNLLETLGYEVREGVIYDEMSDGHDYWTVSIRSSSVEPPNRLVLRDQRETTNG